MVGPFRPDGCCSDAPAGLPIILQGFEQFSRECDQSSFKAAIEEVQIYKATGGGGCRSRPPASMRWSVNGCWQQTSTAALPRLGARRHCFTGGHPAAVGAVLPPEGKTLASGSLPWPLPGLPACHPEACPQLEVWATAHFAVHMLFILYCETLAPALCILPWAVPSSQASCLTCSTPPRSQRNPRPRLVARSAAHESRQVSLCLARGEWLQVDQSGKPVVHAAGVPWSPGLSIVLAGFVALYFHCWWAAPSPRALCRRWRHLGSRCGRQPGGSGWQGSCSRPHCRASGRPRRAGQATTRAAAAGGPDWVRHVIAARASHNDACCCSPHKASLLWQPRMLSPSTHASGDACSSTPLSARPSTSPCRSLACCRLIAAPMSAAAWRPTCSCLR